MAGLLRDVRGVHARVYGVVYGEQPALWATN